MLSEKKLQQVKELAEKYKDVPAPFGEDIDLSKYPIPRENLKTLDSLSELSDDHKTALSKVGVDVSEKDTLGSYIQINNDPVYTKMYSDIEIMPITETLKKYDIEEYYWNVVEIKDKYSARVADEITEGYFIRAPKGVKKTIPLQTCLLIGTE
jgi:Fe-S cluster assembly scaffold protein SufB